MTVLNQSRRDRLKSSDGLCTSIAQDPYENSLRMIAIIIAWQTGEPLQFAHRSEDDWTDLVDGPPMDFTQYRYRIVTERTQ